MTKSEKDIAFAERRWAKKKLLKERKYQLKKEKREFKATHSFKISVSKILILFLFLNCTAIEVFTGYVTLRSIDIAYLTSYSPDFSPLVTLIGAVVSEVIGFAIYALKSAKENTAGGIVFETAMAHLQTADGQESKDIDPDALG